MHTFRARTALAAVGALALVGVACASNSSSTSAAGSGAASGVCASADLSAGDALATVCTTGTLRVATDAKYKPASWYDVQSQQWNGFDVDVANEVAKRLGVTTDLKGIPWAVITAGSWSDRWDVSVGSMTDTVAREALFKFTPPYYYTPAAVAVYKDNTTINNTSTDLEGKKICVGVQTTYQDYVQGDLVLGESAPPFVFQISNADLSTFTTDTDALDNLALGDGVRCDAASSAAPIIQGFINDGGPVKIVGDPLYYEPLCLAFDKNDPTDNATLNQAVNTIIQAMHADGTLTTLSQKWWGADLTTSSAASPSPSS